MRLSSSSLGIYEECPRCFYLDKKMKVSRPRGIFPSLPNGMDRVLKEWSDERRGQMYDLKHKFFDDQKLLKKWRHWRSGLVWEDEQGNEMIGALDDLLVNESGALVPLDYKTKGSRNTQEKIEKYYQRQIDVYALLLSTSGFPVADYGIIQSMHPGVYESDNGIVFFESESFVVQAEPKRAINLFKKAIRCLNAEITPPRGEDCEYCKFVANREGAFSHDAV